jgi:hypothetical protein
MSVACRVPIEVREHRTRPPCRCREVGQRVVRLRVLGRTCSDVQLDPRQSRATFRAIWALPCDTTTGTAPAGWDPLAVLLPSRCRTRDEERGSGRAALGSESTAALGRMLPTGGAAGSSPPMAGQTTHRGGPPASGSGLVDLRVAPPTTPWLWRSSRPSPCPPIDDRSCSGTLRRPGSGRWNGLRACTVGVRICPRSSRSHPRPNSPTAPRPRWRPPQ